MGEGEGRIKEFLSCVPIKLTVLLDRDSDATKAWKVRNPAGEFPDRTRRPDSLQHHRRP
jgi:hypothetical protein